jgi:hypothetical protein
MHLHQAYARFGLRWTAVWSTSCKQSGCEQRCPRRARLVCSVFTLFLVRHPVRRMLRHHVQDWCKFIAFLMSEARRKCSSLAGQRATEERLQHVTAACRTLQLVASNRVAIKRSLQSASTREALVAPRDAHAALVHGCLGLAAPIEAAAQRQDGRNERGTAALGVQVAESAVPLLASRCRDMAAPATHPLGRGG